MKISHKLTFGFLVIAFLLGGLGFLYFRINSKIKNDSERTLKSAILEFHAGTEIVFSLEASQEAAEEILLEKYQKYPKYPKYPNQEIPYLKQKAKENLENTAHHIKLGKEATQIALQMALSASDEPEILEIKEELKLLNSIDTEFFIYKSILSEYLQLIEINPDYSHEFLEIYLEPQFRNKIMPLAQKYRKQALEETEEASRSTIKSIDYENKIIAISSIFAFVVAILLGLLISNHISRPIARLKDAALQISTGRLDTEIEVNRQDELGILAQAFNQMIEGLKEKTVSKNYLDNILASMAESLIVIAPDKTIQKINHATLKLLGYEESELINQSVQFIFAEDIEPDLNNLAQTGVLSNYEATYIRKDGKKIPVAFSSSLIRNENGEIQGIVCVARDMTEQYLAQKRLRESREQLRHQALHDQLTGLPNRTFFRERLEELLKLAHKDPDYIFAVLFLDVDRFKGINDSLGHLAGDQLLIEIANRLKACQRSGDTFARLGGDEFAILIEDIKEIGDATAIADRLQKELALPFELSGHEVFVTISIGIAISKTDYDRIENLLRDADTAMYYAKAMGKARHAVFDQAMHIEAVKLLHLENDLRRAVARQEFQVLYQPIWKLTNSKTNRFKISGFEALVRWQHPERGLISPAEFISVAEETGLIVPIGWWVMGEACRQMGQWQERYSMHPLLTLSVNISAKQFSQTELEHRIAQVLQETGLAPRSLKLEITESAIIDNIDRGTLIIEQLKTLGIRFSIDDFGTGYSSLSYLYRLPIDTLKIDRSFINDIDTDRDKFELTRTIVNLACNLGMDMIAEGVETIEQVTRLTELKCEYGQGYFFSKPVSREEAEALIAAI